MAVLRSFPLRFSALIVLALLIVLAAGGGRSAHAATFTVTKTADTADGTCDADCSLREAVIAANTAAGTDTITVPAGTYTLSIIGTGEDAAGDGDLDITGDVSITGAGAATTIIDGNGGVTGERALQVLAANVQLTNVTITNGGAAGTGRGGGIHNVDWSSLGSLILTNVTVASNAAFNGAGIANDGGTLTVNDSAISGNATTGNSGGGIINDSGTLVLNNTSVSGNSTTGASRPGGGIANFGGTVTIDNSIFTGNTATGEGGGIYNTGGEEDGPPGPLAVTDSTFSGNTASERGGGIHNEGSGAGAITGSTFSGNTALTAGGAISNGVDDSPGTLTLTNVTISGNAASSGAGINNFLGSTVTLTNVTISGNTADVGGGVTNGGTATLTNTIAANSVSGSDCNGPIVSSGNNIDSDGTCGLGVGDFPLTDPNMGILADNGGPTQTHALLAGSQAIDNGDNAACPATDQRGVARPEDGDDDGTATCDIGAYEFELVPTPTATPTTAPAATPTATPAPAALPPTGGEPAGSSSLVWPAVVLAGIIVLSGGLALARQLRRAR